MADYELTFEPQIHQRHVIEALRLFSVVWMCGGLGSGKTWLLVWYGILMSQVMAPGIDGLIVEPDYDTFRDVYMVLWRDNYEGEGYLWDLRNSQKHGRHLWVKGQRGNPDTRIYYRSAHNEQYVRKIDSLTSVGWGGLDEPSRMQCGKRAFELTQGRTRSKRILDLGWKHNPILVVGVPDGFNWLADVFGLTSDHPKHAYETGYITRPNPDEAPDVQYYVRACYTRDNIANLDPNYERSARLIWDASYANQMFAASLVHAQNAIFPEWAKDLHVLSNEIADRMWADKAIYLFGGSDEGSTAPAAAYAMAWTTDQELLVIDEWYRTNETVITQGVEMHGMERRWVPLSAAYKRMGAQGWQWYHDPSGAGTIDLWRRGFEHDRKTYTLDVRPAKYQGSSSTHTGAPSGWQARISLLRSLMLPRRTVRHPNPNAPIAASIGAPRFYIAERCVHLQREIAAYRNKPQEEGKPPREGAVGHDHGIDSVCGGAITTAVAAGVRTW